MCFLMDERSSVTMLKKDVFRVLNSLEEGLKMEDKKFGKNGNWYKKWKGYGHLFG